MLRDGFLAWQCRIRQMAARDYDARPLPAMQPRVSGLDGEVILPAMTVLLVPRDPEAATAFFRFQVQKTSEAAEARTAGVGYLAAGFYRGPELFRDELTAVFAPASAAAVAMLRHREVLLDFAQYSQSFRMFCKVRQLAVEDPARAFSLWQSRIFNPAIPADAVVLAFRPDWRNAAADPMP